MLILKPSPYTITPSPHICRFCTVQCTMYIHASGSIHLNEIVLFGGFNIVSALHFIIALKRNECVQQFSAYTHIMYIARCQRDGVAKSNIKFKRVWSFTFLRINIGILKWLMFITKHYWSQCEILKSDSKKFDLFFPMNARHGRINERLCCTANRALYPSVLKWKQQEWQQTGK